MSHQPFEDWLFAEEPLSPDEDAALQSHLLNCLACRQLSDSLGQLDHLMRSSSMAEPEPGFTSRWQDRLESDRQRLHRRQSLAILLFSMGGAALLFASLGLLLWPLFDQPSVFFWTGVYRLLQMFSVADGLGDSLRTLAQYLPTGISPVSLILLTGIVCELGVLWIVSLRLITNPRRVMKE